MTGDERELKTNATAVLALVIGVVGFCFWGIGGLAAIVLGFVARSQIARSEGREGGTGLAWVGIALGTLNLASIAVTGGALLFMAAKKTPSLPFSAPTATAFSVPTATGATPSAPHPKIKLGLTSRESGTHELSIGKIRLVDVRPDSENLRHALERQQRAATQADEKLLLFVAGDNCLPCNGVALALEDARTQRALASVRIVRVDASDYGAELNALGIPLETIPGFALLSADLRPLDYIHGGEWDADIAENIAPVLGAFVARKYLTRRHPYRAATRPDETAL